MIWTRFAKPYILGETISNPKIQMLPIAAEVLQDASRINYAKKYTIEHNFRVKFIGQISPSTSNDFWFTLNAVNYNPAAPPQPPPQRPSSSRGNYGGSQTSRNSQMQAGISKHHRKK